jgi:hypothetical protein
VHASRLAGTPQIQARHPQQHDEHAAPRLHARRIAEGAEQAAALERRERAAIVVLAVSPISGAGGMRRAIAELGVIFGRPPKLNPKQRRLIAERYAKGETGRLSV